MGLSTSVRRDLSLLEALSQAPGSEAQASCHPALGKTHCMPETVIHRACTAQSCLGQAESPAVLSQEQVCGRDITRGAACSQRAGATDACEGQPEGHIQGLGLSGSTSHSPHYL